ncbi:MAG: sigma-70 family RNA polymerase sigma factor [Lachnospiraceae bacterium]|nr:sigma-70 family RNA polymerase sigma factor [Lachnospiraceae bacterium]
MENNKTNEQLVALIRAGENVSSNMLMLWEQNKGFIAKVARRYFGYAEMDDLMQEGYLGLSNAVDHYDLSYKVPFINYAALWIRQNITRYIENTGTVRIPSWMQNKIMKYKKIEREYQTAYNRKPTDREMRGLLDVSEGELASIKENAEKGQIRSLSEPVTSDSEDITLYDAIASDEDLEEDALRKRDHEIMTADLDRAIAMLPERQQIVLKKRYKEGCTGKEAATELGCSDKYIYRLERQALTVLARPGRSKGYRIYFEQYISANTIRHVGVESFQRTGYSEVERAVLGW